MQNLSVGYKALVIGASGAIGSALLSTLQTDPRCSSAIGISRQSAITLDITDENSIRNAASRLAEFGPFDLIFLSTGMLHQGTITPEKKLSHLELGNLHEVFAINTFGPALVIKHFHSLLSKQKSFFVCLSAKLGSIEDNRLGGWYSYRASKAALNMLIKTASIEVRRTHPETTFVAMHPGTVKSKLSMPFSGEKLGQLPNDAARKILQAIEQSQSNAPALFLSYDGSVLPW